MTQMLRPYEAPVGPRKWWLSFRPKKDAIEQIRAWTRNIDWTLIQCIFWCNSSILGIVGIHESALSSKSAPSLPILPFGYFWSTKVLLYHSSGTSPMFQPTKNNMCRSFSDIWRFLPNFSSLDRKGGRQSKFWNSVTSLHWYWSRGIMNNQLSSPTFLPWTKCAPVRAIRRSWKDIIIIINIENNVNININILSSTEVWDKRILCSV